MEHKGFGAEITFNSTSNRFDGIVVGASASLSFTGKSVAELERTFRSVVEDHLAQCSATKKDPHREFSGKFVLRVEPQVHRDACLMAHREGVSLNKYVEFALIERLERW